MLLVSIRYAAVNVPSIHPLAQLAPMQESRVYLPGYVNCYVTPEGRVFNNGKEKVPIQKKNRAPQVRVQENNQTRHYGLATLVANHFVPNPNGYTKLLCKDGNNRNCAAANLCWVSGQEYTRQNLFRRKPLSAPRSRKATGKTKAQIEEAKQQAAAEKQQEKEALLLPADPNCLPIPGFPHYYASPSGDIWSKNRRLTPQCYPNKGSRVKVKPAGGKLARYTVARLVAATFVPNPHQHPRIIFSDRDKTNCTPANLQWVSEGCFRSFYKKGSEDLLGAPVQRKKPLPTPAPRHPGSKPVAGHPGYFISPEGVVYKGSQPVRINCRKGKSAKVKLRLGTSQPATYRSFGLATLVAQHFIPNPKGHRYVIFKDRNHHHCHRDNIAWVDGETFMWYSGLLQNRGRKKKIVLTQATALQQCRHAMLLQYYKTLDEDWIKEIWNHIEKKLGSNPCWKHYRSECYIYFMDRIQRFSILKDPVGLLLCYLRTLSNNRKKEISDNMPLRLVLTTDESLRDVRKGYLYDDN